MPETFDDRPVVEVALWVYDKRNGPNGEPSAKKGDIIAVRRERGSFGRGLAEHGNPQRKLVLWVRMQGLDWNDWAAIKRPWTERDDLSNPGVVLEKRRYCIPFDRLAKLRPDLSFDKIEDRSLEWQPDAVIDADTTMALHRGPVLDPIGLIFDKKTMKYLE